MTEDVRALVAMCAAVGARNREAVGLTMDAAAQQSNPQHAEEALLQSYLFIGYPLALQALATWRERTGIAAPAAATPDDASKLRSRGEAVCQTVYAGQYSKLRGNIAHLHPDMERWMLEEGYGKVLARSGLDLVVRELCIVALLVGLDAPHQLYSHMRGALNAGATWDDVETAVELACAHANSAAQENARSAWHSVRARKAEKGLGAGKGV